MPSGVPQPSRSGRPVARSATVALAVAVAVVVSVVATRGGGDSGPSPAASAGSGVVLRVVDGDTLVVDVEGADERVRLIGVDTPESVALERPVQCYGAEASAELARLVPIGTEVRLERDEVARDQYGRLLAYLYRSADDLLVNLTLIEGGFADAVTYGDNEALYDVFTAAEARARADEVGLWGACGGPDVDIAPPPGR